MIRHTGDVYPCCELGNSPSRAVGNINQESIANIINGPRLQEMRRQSLEGKLPCYENCGQAKYFEVFPIERPSDVWTHREWYTDLQIEYGELCNVDCIMCWQDRTNKTQLPFEFLKERLPLDSWKVITVYGGEVFVMKDALKHTHHILDLNMKNLVIITNGKTLSNPELAEKIIKNGLGLNISLNAATERTHTLVMRPREPFFDQVIRNVKNLQELKRRFRRPDFIICGHYTAVIESLHEIPDFIENFQSFGFDTASITFDHRFFPRYFAENPQIVRELAPRIARAFTKVKDRRLVTIAGYGLFDSIQFPASDSNADRASSLGSNLEL